MANTKITAELDKLIKKASSTKKADDISSKLDADKGGTSPATTGSQAASNKEEAGKLTEANVDAKAKDNPEGASVTNSPDGASAADVNGQAGAKGSLLADGAIKLRLLLIKMLVLKSCATLLLL